MTKVKREAKNALFNIMYSDTVVSELDKAVSTHKNLPFVKSPQEAVELFLAENKEYNRLSDEAKELFDKKIFEDFLASQVNFLQISEKVFYIA